MRYKKFKKAIAMILMYAFMTGLVPTPANAHDQDYFTGGTVAYNTQDMGFWCFTNNAVLGSDIWEEVRGTRGWNNISSKVKITRINQTPAKGYDTFVLGTNLGSGKMGMMIPFDTQGNQLGDLLGVSSWGMAQNWSKAQIVMNNDPNIWGTSSIALAKTRASAVFIHEVGHALKLKHPTGFETPGNGHNYEVIVKYVGYRYFPQSIMNEPHVDTKYSDYPDFTGYWVLSVTDHDKLNLRKRWGN